MKKTDTNSDNASRGTDVKIAPLAGCGFYAARRRDRIGVCSGHVILM